MKATYHFTQEVHVHPTTGLHTAYMVTKVNAHTNTHSQKVKAMAGCKFNRDITTTSMTL